MLPVFRRATRRFRLSAFALVIGFYFGAGWSPLALAQNAPAAAGVVAVAPGLAATSAAGVPPDYRLAPRDLVNVTVYNMPELSRQGVGVGADGNLRIGYLASPVPAADQTVDAVARVIRADLQEQQVLLDPQVDVSVAQVLGREVIVSGEVRSPASVQAYGDFRLLDALVRAGGPSAAAGDVVVVTRPAGDGSPGFSRRISLAALMKGSDPDSNVELRAGDVVRVLGSGQVYVAGDVKTPGVFSVPPSGLSVTKVVALTQGWNSDADPSRAAVMHRKENGDFVSTPVDLVAIMDRAAPDPVLSAGDVLFVPTNTRRSVLLFTAKATVAALVAAVAYVIVTK